MPRKHRAGYRDYSDKSHLVDNYKHKQASEWAKALTYPVVGRGRFVYANIYLHLREDSFNSMFDPVAYTRTKE